MVQLAGTGRLQIAKERRRSERQPLCLDLEVERADGSTELVQVQDLSRRGLAIHSINTAHIGERLFLPLPQSGTVQAQVVWRCGNHYGCEFLHPIGTAALSAALLKARPARQEERVPDFLRPSGPSEQPVIGASSGLFARLPLLLGISALLWCAILLLLTVPRG